MSRKLKPQSLDDALGHARRDALKKPRTSAFALSLGSPWAPSTTHKAPTYRRIDGMVHLEGVVTSGVISSSIAVLPSGYRAGPDRILFISVDSGGLARVEIRPNGEVWCLAGTGTQLTLSGIYYAALT